MQMPGKVSLPHPAGIGGAGIISGLPDCTSENGTLSERQRAAANKMRMTGNLSRRFYEWLVAQYWFTRQADGFHRRPVGYAGQYLRY